MDARGQIYKALPGTEVPAEDRTRLEGYLLAREDMIHAQAEEGTGRVDPALRQRLNEAERLRLADEARRRHRRNS